MASGCRALAGRHVAVLGGGMAGLTAAWELSRPEHRESIAGVTVYQRGWRLGGKGASSRGVHGRIEEHGLHVWLGYYDNAFRLVRQVYEELDRPTTDPGCPIRTWRDAFVPSDLVGVAEAGPGGWEPWLVRFGRNRWEPGDPGAAAIPPTSPARFAERAAALLADLWSSLRPVRRPPAGVFLSASPVPPGTATRLDPLDALAGLGDLVPGAERRLGQVADLLLTCLRGIVADGLVGGTHRYPSIDDRDFRHWLAHHGARPETLRSPIVNALYDLVFAYERGDPERPAFAAGLGLFLASKLFFEYKGSLFWKMRAGMGDVVFAPLYQALRARGVRFELFTRAHAVRLDDRRRGVAAVELARQARVVEGPGGYRPLVRVRGLPCFPSVPDATQVHGDPPLDAEHHDGRRDDEERVTLHRGDDFDVVVLAVSLGMVPHVGAELVASSDRWRRLVDHVATVPTQAVQLWLTRTEPELGWEHPGATLSGWAKPLDTYASMSHLLPLEDWPDGDRPQGLAYLCSTLADGAGTGDATGAGDGTGDGAGSRADEEAVRRATARVLSERMGDLWPRAQGPEGFRWDVLHGGLAAQHVTAATDPSDRYVQSLPGTDRHRLRVDESGVDGLVLAGDWTNCGLNAGCIEAAVLSGLQAANAVLGRPLLHGVLGTWYPLGREGDEAPRP